jgi:anthranilate phosphoribosyltransferase
MTCDETAMRRFGAEIQRLIGRGDLSRQRTCELFCEVLRGDQSDLQQGAFLAALVAKGETPQEIAGAWQAIVEVDTVAASVDLSGPLVENSGTGMDELKTFNVSSAAALIAAAQGVRIARHGARALTSKCGAVDILEAVGVDVECDAATVKRSIEQTGIGIFNGMSPAVHPGGLGRILSQIRFGSTLNIAASLANPARPTHGVRGVYADRLVGPVGEVMAEIGYQRALVVHGFDAEQQRGMDELSVLGPSRVVEIGAGGRRDVSTVEPEDVGLRRSRHEDIAPLEDLRDESRRFVRVLAGRGHGACVDAACYNAAAVLYVAGVVDDLAVGVERSRATVENGAALARLRQWVAVQSAGDSGAGERRLEEVLAGAGLAA